MANISLVPVMAPTRVAGTDVTSGGTSTVNATATNLLGQDPREVAVIPVNSGGNTFVDIDLGKNVLIDSFFIGYHTATDPTQTVQFEILGTFGGTPVRATTTTQALLYPGATGPNFHASASLATPVTGRFVRAIFSNPVAAFNVGLFSVGLSWQPTYNFEVGSGRPIVDTGSSERLQSGGWGINTGAILGGFQWTFGDLQPAELASLYALLRSVGLTKPLWVVEDDAQTAGINERTHYGIFTKIEPYTRKDALNSAIGLQMEEWV